MSDAPIARKAGDYLKSVPRYDETRDYLGPFFHAPYRVTVAGPMKHGKTSLLMEAAAAAARGSNFIGFKGAGVPTAYVDLEMGDEQTAEAMVNARLDVDPPDNLTVVAHPTGLKIDEKLEDRRFIQKLAADHKVLIIDPWHKVVAQELGESRIVRQLTGFLDTLRQRYPETCVVIGFHAQEPQTPRSQIQLGNISGFKAFQRGADIVATIQRIGTNTTRLMWVASRSPRLGVGFNEKWQLEWAPGQGFTRTDVRTSEERAFSFITDEWQNTSWLMATSGLNPADKNQRSNFLRTLAHMEVEGRVESQGSSRGGRGHEKSWRRRDPNQGVIQVDLAA